MRNTWTKTISVYALQGVQGYIKDPPAESGKPEKEEDINEIRAF